MTAHDLRRAACLLAANARGLRDCHTSTGRKWPDDPDSKRAKAEHVECMTLAKGLRDLARQVR